jgi:hypothetical protein
MKFSGSKIFVIFPIFWHFLTARIIHRITYLNYIILYCAICNLLYYIRHLSKVTKKVKKLNILVGDLKNFPRRLRVLSMEKGVPRPESSAKSKAMRFRKEKFSRESVPRHAGHTSPQFRTHGVPRPIAEIILFPSCIQLPEHVLTVVAAGSNVWCRGRFSTGV